MHLCSTIETESLDVDYVRIPVLYNLHAYAISGYEREEAIR